MTQRGFFILEVLIALTIAISGIVAISLLALGMPEALENRYLEYRAHKEAESALWTAEELLTSSEAPPATTTNSGSSIVVSLDVLPGEAAALSRAHISWSDARGNIRSFSLQGAVVDKTESRRISCVPFSFGSWKQPQSSSRAIPRRRFSVSSLAATNEALAVAAYSVGTSTEPTILFFPIEGTGEPGPVLGAADNASSSVIGFSALSNDESRIYAANAFGSASARTCATHACAQLQIFEARPSYAPALIGYLQLPSHTKPWAVTADGASAGAHAVAHRRQFIYLGLLKTAAGYEFNIIDVSNPGAPFWVGGVAIGRSVNSIALKGPYAYLATSDPERELVIVDISNPSVPKIVASWDARGAANFGVGSAVAVRHERAYLGRSFTPNGAELLVLDVSDPAQPSVVEELDLGSSKRPVSIRALLVRDHLLYGVTNFGIHVWDGLPADMKSLWEGDMPGGSALACRSNTLFAASLDPMGSALLWTFDAT